MSANVGDSITAISVATPISPTNPNLQDTTSEFAAAVVSDSGPAFGGPVVNAGGGGVIVAGSTFTSQGSFTDTTSESWTATVDYGDGSAPQTLRINPVSLTAGSGDQYSNVGAATFNLSHVYAKAGSYSVVVDVTNDSGRTRPASGFTVNVVAAPPTVNNTDIHIAPASNPSNTSSPTIIDENQAVVLTGSFADINPGVTHTVNIVWGDGSTSPATVDETTQTFTADHTYLDPGTINSASGVFTVEVQVTSTAGLTASTTSGLFYVQVDDVPPSNLELTTDLSTIDEGGVVNLSGSFVAPGPLDTHEVTIDWGDGTPKKTLGLAGGVLSFAGISHQYLDYAPGAAGSPFTIQVSVNDLYQPLAPVTATTDVVVNAAPATQIILHTLPNSLNEGGSVTLSGSFVAPGPLDHHNVSIDWGDGTNPTLVVLGAGVSTFSGITHPYSSNSLLQPGGAFTITATVADPGQPAATAGVGTTSVVVQDVASVVSNLAVTFIGGGAIPIVGAHPQVTARTTVSLTGKFTRPDPQDSYALLITWGDGSASTAPMVYLSNNTFVATHLVADSAPGTLLSLYDIHVTVTDVEQTTGFGDFSLAVAHVAPIDQIRSGGISGDAQTLTAQISGGDASPITYQWSIDGVQQTDTSASFTLPSTPDTSYIVSSTATDDHGATSQFTARVDVLDDSNSTYEIPAPTTTVSAIIVSGLAGNHVIAGGTIVMNGGNPVMSNGVPELINPLTVPIVFDGNGQETYIGDNASDVFYLHTDGSIGYGEGGDNVFALTPNCTLTAVVAAGQNTLDFSSSTYGVTFDLSQTTGQTQDVDPIADQGQHFVIADASGTGRFSTLVGSNGNDSITAAANTTIDGGGGHDSIAVNSTIAKPVGGVTIGGSSDGDTLITTGPGIGNINFQGDSGADQFTNMGTIVGVVAFNGGADANAFTNMGSISGAVTFGGGADGGTFTNMGTVTGNITFTAGADGGTFTNTGTATGTLTFGGGSDAGTFINNDAQATLGAIVFTGDEGANTFTNNGVTGVVTYTGGSDSNTLVNNAGGTIAGINFQGDTGADALTNAGTVTGTINYGGGSDSDNFINNGTLVNVNFNGDQGADTFTNNGMITGTLTYGGGSDSDVLTNTGSIQAVTYTGGSDAGVFVNSGTVGGAVTYNGGSDADSFTNSANSSVGSIIYNGGADAGTLTNNGSVTGSVTYGGGSDSDAFTNNGSVVGGVVYTGGADAGSFTNNGTVTGGVTYGGGSDSDLLTNNGALGAVTYNGGSDAGALINNGSFSTITYNGGSDSDTFTNASSGGATGTVNFNGDTGVDQLVNLGTLGGIVYTGGSDSDTLLNPGTVSGTIVFNGDDGADTLENGAIVNGVVTPGTVGSIIFTGGADTDTLLNPGTVTGAIIFNGDQGAQPGATIGGKTLINSGQADSITINGDPDGNGGNNFSGDSGAETLVNNGTVVGAITFNGDGGADQLLNAAGSGVGAIIFNGGADSNLLVNQASGVASITYNAGGDANVLNNTGSDFGSINFQGDSGTDTLVNTGSGGTASSIIFNGGADSGTLVNSGSGLGTINYNGDEGSNTLINVGSNIGQITFGGGADGGAFLNAGNNVSVIIFNGGADANVFRNDGTQIGSISYTGDLGSRYSGYFLNNGSVASITYNGGSDSDTLVNNGTVGSTGGGTGFGIIFQGDGGADLIINTANGTINGLVFGGGADSDTLVNAGALTNLLFLGGSDANAFVNSGALVSATVNFQGDDGAGQFVNQAGGTASNINYDGGSDSDAFINYGSLSTASYNGDAGAGSMYLDGTVNKNVTYNGGSDGDQLIIGPDAGVVSNILFNGGSDADLLANEANGATGITFMAGSDADDFWNFGANADGLVFIGGAGADAFYNSGSGATGIVFRGDTGADTLTNVGDNVGTIIFTGGSDANTLTNSGVNTGSIVYNAGSDSDTLTNTGNGVQSITFNGDDGVDSLVNSGSHVVTITYNGGSDSDSFVNSGGAVGTIVFVGDAPATTFTDSGSAGSVTFTGGDGTASFIYSAIGAAGSTVTFTAKNGGNIFVDSGSAGSASVDLGLGDNQAVIMTGAAGDIDVAGGDGDNTYFFSGAPQADVTVDQPLFPIAGTMGEAGGTPFFIPNPSNPDGSQGGIDTLDFSSFTGGGIDLDLMSTSPQAVATGLTLTLVDPEGISNAIGSQYTNQIFGNLRPDVISTADLPDDRVASDQDAPPPAFTPDARTQWVYLDFDKYTVAGDHVYTTDERSEILSRIQADYYGPDPTHPWFDVQITDDINTIPADAVATGEYATLFFNRTPPSGLPGGEASEVDLGNRDMGGYASIQINGMVGGGDQPANTSEDFILLSSKVGAHELAHLMGVRHSDAFGPIGFGVHTPPGSSEFNPTYDGPDAAFETFDHLISSPATVGSDRFNDLRDLDFGPREAVKLAFASQGTTIVAPTGTHGTVESAEPISLAPLTVPNTDVTLPDVEKSLVFQVGAIDVEGTLSLDPTTGEAAPDYYTLTGRKGDIDTIEVDSQELGRLAGQDTIDSVVDLFDSFGNLIAHNDDQYEGTDSLLMDVTLPATGTYYIRVSSFAATPGDPEYDPTNPASPLSSSNLDSIINPLNPDFSQAALTSFLNAKAGTATGQYDLFIYRFGEADPIAANVDNVLVARGPNSTLSGSTGADTLIGPAGTLLDDSNAGPGGAVSITASVTNPTVDLPTPFQDDVSLNGPTGAKDWNVTIDYGDDSAPTLETVSVGSDIPLFHQYHASGNFSATVTIETGGGTFGITVPVSVADAQPPSEEITAPDAGAQFAAETAVGFSAALQNPDVGVNYLATWTFTNTADASQVLTATQRVLAKSTTPFLDFTTFETFTVPANYLVQLTIEDLANGMSTTVQTVGGAAAEVTIVPAHESIATSITATAPNATFTAESYNLASAVVTAADGSVLSSPAVTFSYYNGADASLAHPLSAAPTEAGGYLVVATFAGDATYSASTSSPASFTISPAALTITADNQTKVYGAALPTFTASYSGFVDGESAASLTTLPTLTTTATASSHVSGSPYAINVGGAVDEDYTISYVAGALTVTAVPLTITADNQTKVYGTALPSLTASYMGFVNGDTSASLTTQPTLSTTATAASHVVGSPYAITVGGAVDGDYSISYVAGSLTVTAAPLTISADDKTKVYGAALPTLTASYSGLVNGDASTSLATQPTLSTTATANSHVGGSPYAINVGGAADTDYNISYVAGALTVTAAPLTITEDKQSKSYGPAPQTLTASYSGFVNGDTSASLTTQPTLSTTATAASHVAGSPYAINVGGAADTDYNISYVAGALTVTAAPLTITADNQTKVYGAAPPTLTASYMGFVNGDTSASLTTQPTLSTTATTASHVVGSPYAITVGGAVDGDYSISYVAGSLTVTAAPLTISADDKTKVYGAALPTLTASYSGLVNGDASTSLATQPTLSTTTTAASRVAGSPYAINVGGAADTDYNISYVAGSLTVTAALLTISADDKTKVYGAALPMLTASYSGLVNGDASTSLTTQPTLSTAATAGSHVAGSPYAINVGGAADTDYNISYVAAALTVTAAPLTITADNQTKVYGAALPTLTASYAGLVNGDTPTSLTTQPTLSTTATAASHVAGSPYVINVGGAADTDYNISYVAGALTVTAAPLTITADNQSKAYGAALPTLTASYSGFVNGDTSASLTTQPTLSTTATAASHVAGSPYAINIGGAVDSDYTISYVAGSLTVTTAPLTITANNQNKVYGTALPTLTASYSGFVNGDASASLTTKPALSTTATAASHVSGSPYAINIGGAARPRLHHQLRRGGAYRHRGSVDDHRRQSDQGLRRGVADAHGVLRRLREWRHFGQPDDAAHGQHDGDRR